MLIDTHCHLTSRYNSDAGAMIARARDAGVGALVCATAEPGDWADAVALCEKYENVFCTIGVHPEYANSIAAGNAPSLAEGVKLSGIIAPFLNHPRTIGVGEIGLDYHYDKENKNQQIELFHQQLQIARDADLPVAIHTRDAEEDTARILEEYVGAHICAQLPQSGNNIIAAKPRRGTIMCPYIPGVMHCFTGSWDFAKKMLDLGFYFSASGIITFKNSQDLRETFGKIPIDRIVIETDSPWCAPVPYRGKPCEPAFVVETAKVIASIKNLQLPELEIILEENTKKLYPKIK